VPDVIARLLLAPPGGLVVAYLVVIAMGGLMYAMMHMSTRSMSSPASMAVRRPGWIARRRARGGIAHRRGRVGVGYSSAFGSVDVTAGELAQRGALFGGPGSG
jgi:hypothetical protein